MSIIKLNTVLRQPNGKPFRDEIHEKDKNGKVVLKDEKPVVVGYEDLTFSVFAYRMLTDGLITQATKDWETKKRMRLADLANRIAIVEDPEFSKEDAEIIMELVAQYGPLVEESVRRVLEGKPQFVTKEEKVKMIQEAEKKRLSEMKVECDKLGIAYGKSQTADELKELIKAHNANTKSDVVRK